MGDQVSGGICQGSRHDLAADGYFSTFISNGVSTELCFIVFTLYSGNHLRRCVRNGIERVSRIAMPILVVLSRSSQSILLPGSGALSGVKYFLIPRSCNFLLDDSRSCHGQMFYSLSIAMGILITFGSYMKRCFHRRLHPPPKM